MKLRGSHQFSQARDAKTTDTANFPPKLVVFTNNCPVGVADVNVFLPSA